MNGRTGATIPFSRKDDGGDLVETSYLVHGPAVRAAVFRPRRRRRRRRLRQRINYIWGEVEWNWYTQGGRKLLYWHWSPNNGWALDHEIRGWNECLITYVLAAVLAALCRSSRSSITAASPAAAISSTARPITASTLPLGPAYGGPLFFAHYSFLRPRSARPQGPLRRLLGAEPSPMCAINRAHCVANPARLQGLWQGLLGPDGERRPATAMTPMRPDNDNGTISPTAALASFPYAPEGGDARACAISSTEHGDKVWGRYGFIDAFNPTRDWYADTFLAIDQGPIIVMIENYRTGLLWKLFMSVPEIQAGLRRLGLHEPAPRRTAAGLRERRPLEDWIEPAIRLFRAGDAGEPSRRPASSRRGRASARRSSPRPGSIVASPVPAVLGSRSRLFLPLVPRLRRRHRRAAHALSRTARSARGRRMSPISSRFSLSLGDSTGARLVEDPAGAGRRARLRAVPAHRRTSSPRPMARRSSRRRASTPTARSTSRAGRARSMTGRPARPRLAALARADGAAFGRGAAPRYGRAPAQRPRLHAAPLRTSRASTSGRRRTASTTTPCASRPPRWRRRRLARSSGRRRRQHRRAFGHGLPRGGARRRREARRFLDGGGRLLPLAHPRLRRALAPRSSTSR